MLRLGPRCFFHAEKINPIRWSSSYFITTPVFYVNAEPHIGHLYTCVLADARARYEKLKNPDLNVKFMSGTDEHGLKISTAAAHTGLNEKEYCDTVSQSYRKTIQKFSIGITDFVRTTEDRHKDTVIKLWKMINDKGYIYSGEHEGWYCTASESFVTEKCLNDEADSNGVRYTIDLNQPVTYVKERNYKFKLSHFQTDLLNWLSSGNVVYPKRYQHELMVWINNSEIMNDISVSRPASRVKWGIPVPDDSSQNVYVWFDALCSYLTSSGYFDSSNHWPPDMHVIGKDILKFHGIYWPAFLIAAGLEPPRRILCHSYWMNNDQKMSKSLGNVINPMKMSEKYTSDGFRYYLLHEGTPHKDGSYNERVALNVINSNLANKLGNLLSRCTGKVNPYKIFPAYSSTNLAYYRSNDVNNLMSSLESLPGAVLQDYEDWSFRNGIDRILQVVDTCQKYIQGEKPWNLKEDYYESHVRTTIFLGLETLRISGILLQPIVPQLSTILLDSLSVKREERSFQNLKPLAWERRYTEDINLNVEYTFFPRIHG